jgi:hypothetical protein
MDHFIHTPLALIDWECFARLLINLYKGEREFNCSLSDPPLVLKMELVGYPNNLSVR